MVTRICLLLGQLMLNPSRPHRSRRPPTPALWPRCRASLSRCVHLVVRCCSSVKTTRTAKSLTGQCISHTIRAGCFVHDTVYNRYRPQFRQCLAESRGLDTSFTRSTHLTSQSLFSSRADRGVGGPRVPELRGRRHQLQQLHPEPRRADRRLVCLLMRHGKSQHVNNWKPNPM